MTWLHFIGKQYYSRGKFAREAKKYGVTRRVSLQQLKRMSYGDKVLLAILDGKSPLLFGYFIIEKISGLSSEAIVTIKEKYPCELVSAGGGTISRGCGEYTEGACFAVGATLQEIVDVLEELKDQKVDIGKLMIGGEFEHHFLVRLKDIPFRQGFREIDYKRLIGAAVCEKLKSPGQEWSKKKSVTVHGQFYIDRDADDERLAVDGPIKEVDGLIEEVKNYRRKEQVG